MPPRPSVLESRSEPNYINPVSRGHAGTIVGTLLAGLVTITLAIRLYSRKWLTRGFGLDDKLILAAYVPVTTFTIIGIVAEQQLEWDRHTWDVERQYIAPGLRLVLVNEIIYNLATNLTKLSILTLLYRLTTASRGEKMTIAVLVSITAVVIICFTFVVVSIFQCTPLSDFWHLADRPQNCINQWAYILTASIINTITDWLVVLLPIKTVLGFGLPSRQSIMIMLLFSVGVLASSVGIARSYFTSVATSNDDTTWNSWTVWFCGAIELNLGIICASIPATKPFFTSYLPGIFDSTFRPHISTVVDCDRKHLIQSPSLTTFIDQSSFSSSFLLPRPPPAIPHQPININKPLPPIAYEQENLETRHSRQSSLGEFDMSPCAPDMTPPPRAGVRLSDQGRRLTPNLSRSQDRTTIFIMYRADEDLGPSPKILNRASLA
ncbi:integral membrane protein [Hypoxylon sp. FL1284]|nr:integral membrane protein [Hypoxylon sp. FL1284]